MSGQSIHLKTALIIPVLNAEQHFQALLPALRALKPQPDRVLIIDSSSSDRTSEIALAAGYEVRTISRSEFGHGRTRNWAASLCGDADILVFMTQDAIPNDPHLIGALLAPFVDPKVGHAFARQLPHHDATAAAAFSRHFNYPKDDYTRDASDIKRFGLRAFFSSNSCAAYRRHAFDEMGGFPTNLPVSEDTMIAAKMLLNGYKLSYCSAAQVRHSHNYNLSEEFRRYFDIGAAIRMAPWYEDIGRNVTAEKEGSRFVVEEAMYLLRQGKPFAIVGAFIRNVVRYAGYRFGYAHGHIPCWLTKRLTGQRAFWNRHLENIRA